jgi:hypothetical protein
VRSCEACPGRQLYVLANGWRTPFASTFDKQKQLGAYSEIPKNGAEKSCDAFTRYFSKPYYKFRDMRL